LLEATSSRLAVSPQDESRYSVIADQVYRLGLYGFRVNVGTPGNDNQIRVDYRRCFDANGGLINEPICKGIELGGGNGGGGGDGGSGGNGGSGGADGGGPFIPGPGESVLPPGLVETVDQAPSVAGFTTLPLSNLTSALVPRNTDGPAAGMQKLLSVLGSTVLEQEPQLVRPGSRYARPAVESTASGSQAVSGSEGLSRPYPSPVEMPVEGRLVESAPDPDGNQGFTFTRDTSQVFSDRDGLRSWVRGFGFGLTDIDRPRSNGYFINRADVRGGGAVLGVEASVSPNTQVGVFGNLSSLSVIQTGFGGGGWSPTGWGGGLYGRWSTETFFVGGLLGYTGFSGTQTRTVVLPRTVLTASGEKAADAFNTTLTAGGRINLGPDTLLTPSVIFSWSSIGEQGFTEGGANLLFRGQTLNSANLRYSPRTSSWSTLDLGVSLSQSIRSRQTLIQPSLRLGWFGNWRAGGSQGIGYAFSDRTFNVRGGWLDRNGLRTALGLDVVTAGNVALQLKGTLDLGYDSRGGGAIADYGVNGGFTIRF
jgi:hypothetical protein